MAIKNAGKKFTKEPISVATVNLIAVVILIKKTRGTSVKKFYEVINTGEDGLLNRSSGFYETRKLAQATIGVGGYGYEIKEREMFTEEDKKQKLKDENILKSLTAEQLSALKRNPTFLK